MDMNFPKGIRSSIIFMVVGLVTFVLVASLLLVSNPINTSLTENNTELIIISNHSVDDSFSQNKIEAEEDVSSNMELNSDKGRDRVIDKSNFLKDLEKSTSDVGISENVGLLNGSTSDKTEVDKNANEEKNGSFEIQNDEISSSDNGNVTTPQSRTCDLYQGKWFYDPAGPLYTNNSCPQITQTQNCQGNGRPDKEYEYYRWKPNDCDLPRFNARRFLELTRDKTIAFVGDSVSRNQMESLLCMLWQEEVPKNRGSRRMQRWQFRSTNTMVIRIWSSWLTQIASPSENAPQGVTKVYLDIPDPNLVEFLPSFDILILSSGHWFAKQSAYILNNNVVGGQLWKPPIPEDSKISNVIAFGISVEKVLNAIANNENFTGLAIVRSYSPDHYEGGEWNTGGSCTGKVKPVDKVVRSGFTDVMHEQQISGFKRALDMSDNARRKLRLMDITEVFGYRADGHPGPYRSPDPNKITKRGPNGEPPPQDCLHWCMPGPVDIWNEMLMEVIRREYEMA